MKIIYWSFSTFPSKAANSVNVIKMASYFAKLGHEVILTAIKGEPKINFNKIFERYGVKNNFKIILKNYPKIKFGWILWGLFILKIVFKSKPDLVFSRDSFGAFLSALFGFDVLFEVHGAAHGRDKILFKFLFPLKRIKKIIVISKSLKEYLCQHYRFDHNKIIIAPDAVDDAWVEEEKIVESQKKALGFNSNDFVLGYIGNLYKGRGIKLIINLAKLLPEDKFVLIGGPKNVLKIYNKIIFDLGIQNICFKDYVPHSSLPKYLFSCDILLMPYQKQLKTANDGPDTSKFMSPLKMFEYMSAGKPIIASNHKVIKEVLINKKNALLVEPDKINEWYDSIIKLKSDPKLSNSLGKTAKNHVKKYTWSKRTKLILDNYTILKNN